MVRWISYIALCCVFLYGTTGIALAADSRNTADERQASEQATEKRLKELNKNMDEFAAGARHAGSQARDEINRLYDEFKHKQGSARKDLEEMRKATNEAWEKAKVEMDKAIEEMNSLYERARAAGKEKDETGNKKK